MVLPYKLKYFVFRVPFNQHKEGGNEYFVLLKLRFHLATVKTWNPISVPDLDT